MVLEVGVGEVVACVAWRFLSNLRAIGKLESRDKGRQSREEPGNCLSIYTATATIVTGLQNMSVAFPRE